MISIFCQKSNGGKIETIKDLNEIEDNESDRNHLKILAIKGRPQVCFIKHSRKIRYYLYKFLIEFKPF